MMSIVRFRPNNIKQYIDCNNGWKFTEKDKEFLLKYYQKYLRALKEEYDGDFSDDVLEILNSIEKNGVKKSKALIQRDAMTAASAFGYDIYKKYSDSPDILKLIENSILNVQW